jgi:hypothetical protein
VDELVWKFLYSVVIGVIAEVRSRHRRRASISWPEVQGTVNAQQQIIPPGGSHFNAQLGLSYYYVVQGEYYSGEVPLTEFLVSGESWEALQQRFSHGTKLRVRYRPGKPTIAVAFPAEPSRFHI